MQNKVSLNRPNRLGNFDGIWYEDCCLEKDDSLKRPLNFEWTFHYLVKVIQSKFLGTQYHTILCMIWKLWDKNEPHKHTSHWFSVIWMWSSIQTNSEVISHIRLIWTFNEFNQFLRVSQSIFIFFEDEKNEWFKIMLKNTVSTSQNILSN